MFNLHRIKHSAMIYVHICLSHKSSGLDLIFHLRSVKFEECVAKIGFSEFREPMGVTEMT